MQPTNRAPTIAHFCFIISKADIEKICIEHKMFSSISFDILSEKCFAPINLLASHTRDVRGKACRFA